MQNKIKKELYEFKLLMKSVPSLIISIFFLTVFSMNLLANKSISLPVDWLALDCGFLISWIAFLTMDIITKHFGPKAATEISVLAIFINLLLCLVFFVTSKIPGVWGEAYVIGSEGIINNALDQTFGGAWYIPLGSAFAFAVSALVNNFTNFGIGKLFIKKPDSFYAYACRSYISTALGQFADNLVFSLVVSRVFFGWSLLQCVTCAITGMVVELICEIVFSYFGFKTCQRWKKENVGKEYLQYLKKDEKQ